MSRAPLIVAVLAAGLFNWGCGGGTAGGKTSDGGGNGSGGNGGSRAGTGGTTGSGGGADTGGATGSGGAGGKGSGGLGGTGSGGRGGGGGAGGCAPNQVWCPGCEPGTGACYTGGCPGISCPPPDAGNASGENCHGGMSCAGTASCSLDCMGNTGTGSGLQGPGINCHCENGSYSCRVVWEGTAGAQPPLCPSGPQGGACGQRCNLCRTSASADTGYCFCSTNLSWVCS